MRVIRLPLTDEEWRALRRLFFKTFKETVKDSHKFADFVEAALAGVTRELLKGRTLSAKKVLDTIRQLAEGAGVLEKVPEKDHDKHHEDISKENAPGG